MLRDCNGECHRPIYRAQFAHSGWPIRRLYLLYSFLTADCFTTSRPVIIIRSQFNYLRRYLYARFRRQVAASYFVAFVPLRARRCPSFWADPVLTRDISSRVEQKAASMLFVGVCLCSAIIFYVNALRLSRAFSLQKRAFQLPIALKKFV